MNGDDPVRRWWHNFFSGRFILTIICGITFMSLSLKTVEKPDGSKAPLMDPEDSTLIIAIVFTHYFTKQRSYEAGDDPQTK